MGIAVLFLWVVNFIIGTTFPIMLAALGLSSSFMAFAILGVVAMLFIYKL